MCYYYFCCWYWIEYKNILIKRVERLEVNRLNLKGSNAPAIAGEITPKVNLEDIISSQTKDVLKIEQLISFHWILRLIFAKRPCILTEIFTIDPLPRWTTRISYSICKHTYSAQTLSIVVIHERGDVLLETGIVDLHKSAAVVLTPLLRSVLSHAVGIRFIRCSEQVSAERSADYCVR